jgi:hypothetical protein
VIGTIELKPEWRKTTSDKMEFLVTTAGVDSSEAHGVKEARVKILMLELLHKAESPNPPVYRRIQVSRTCISLREWASCCPESKLVVLI